MFGTQVFYNFTLFDGVNSQVQPDCWLEVADGHIHRIGIGLCSRSDSGIDLGGRTVIPGLIDAHVHLISPFAPEINLAVIRSFHHQIRLNLTNCIRSGVTTVRDMGCTPGIIRRMKRWVKEGKTVGPRILCANSFIVPPEAMPAHVPTFSLPLRLFLGGQVAERASTPDQVRETVRRMVALGADWIKTTHTDKSFFMNRPDRPCLTMPALRHL